MVVISLTAPLKVGIYIDDRLIKEYISQEQTSEVLPKIFNEIFLNYNCKKIFFANGPGSFMAIKVTFIFLRTLSITKNIELLAVDGFYFNENSPIKAMRDRYFAKEGDKIVIRSFKDTELKEFKLPKTLKEKDFSSKIEPLYILPAV